MLILPYESQNIQHLEDRLLGVGQVHLETSRNQWKGAVLLWPSKEILLSVNALHFL